VQSQQLHAVPGLDQEVMQAGFVALQACQCTGCHLLLAMVH
jgi:hypothetical protein